MKMYDYKTKGLEFILSYFRANSDISKFIETIAVRFNVLQEAIKYLLDSLDIKKARGQRLDYIGAEVGASRDEVDYGNYFCVNRLQVNQGINFYFSTSGTDPKTPISLSDAEYWQKIFAYIGANSASGDMEELIKIIKIITGADDVFILRGNFGGIKIKICGPELLMTRNTILYIKQLLGSGIYLEEIITNDETN